MSEPTQGPWEFSKYGSVYSGNTYVFGPVHDPDSGPDIQFSNDVDQRLVLAAPEMYDLLCDCAEVLKVCRRTEVDEYGMVSEMLEDVMDTLKSIEGSV
jgi:hypothetical protein